MCGGHWRGSKWELEESLVLYQLLTWERNSYKNKINQYVIDYLPMRIEFVGMEGGEMEKQHCVKYHKRVKEEVESQGT